MKIHFVSQFALSVIYAQREVELDIVATLYVRVHVNECIALRYGIRYGIYTCISI